MAQRPSRAPGWGYASWQYQGHGDERCQGGAQSVSRPPDWPHEWTESRKVRCPELTRNTPVDKIRCPAEARPPRGRGQGGARVLRAGAGGGARPCPRGPFLEARGWVRDTTGAGDALEPSDGDCSHRYPASQLWPSKLRR